MRGQKVLRTYQSNRINEFPLLYMLLTLKGSYDLRSLVTQLVNFCINLLTNISWQMTNLSHVNSAERIFIQIFNIYKYLWDSKYLFLFMKNFLEKMEKCLSFGNTLSSRTWESHPLGCIKVIKRVGKFYNEIETLKLLSYTPLYLFL